MASPATRFSQNFALPAVLRREGKNRHNDLRRRSSGRNQRRASSYAIAADLADNVNDVFQRHSAAPQARHEKSISARSVDQSIKLKVGTIDGMDTAGDLENKKVTELRKRIRVYLATTSLGYILDVLNGIFSILSVCLVVTSTYGIETSASVYTDLGLCCFFLADYLLRLFIADSRMEQIFSWQALLDAITILPTFAALWTSLDSLDLAASKPWVSVFTTIGIEYIRIFRMLRLRRLLLYLDKEQKKEIGLVVLHVLTGLLFVAAVLFSLENTFRLPLREEMLAYHEIMYFLVVTFSTVGYGDISMATVPGKLLVAGIICLTLLYIPRWTNIILKNIGNTSIYRRSQYVASSHVCHVVVTGFVDPVSARDFLKELFHPDHGNPTLHVVFLMQGSPGEDLLKVLDLPMFRSRITYLDGSPLSTRDLARAKVQLASACFILANKFTRTPHNDDAVAILKALSLKRFVMHHHRPDILVCVQFIRPESKALFTISRASIPCHLVDQVISTEQVKMDILAKSCLCPGFITMLSNLVGSMEADVSEGSSADDYDQLNAAPPARKDTPHRGLNKIFPSFRSDRYLNDASQSTLSARGSQWMSDYKRGAGYEIYRVTLGSAFTGVPFAEAAEILHRRLGIVLFAIDIQAPHSQRHRVVLNPGRFRIPDVEEYYVHAYVIAEDERRAALNFPVRTTHPTMSILVRELSAASKLEEILEDAPGERKAQRPSDAASEMNSSQAPIKKGLWAAMRNDLNGTGPDEELDAANDADNFHLAERQLSLEEATIEISLAAEIPSIRDHVVVIGRLDHVICFVQTLRLKYLQELIPIVLLAEEPPTETVWSRLSRFPLVFFVRGTPLDGNDLGRAGLRFAKAAVIATQEAQDLQRAQTSIDANAILVRKTILQINPTVDLIVEVVNSDNLHLLGNDDDWDNAATAFNKLEGPSQTVGLTSTPLADTFLDLAPGVMRSMSGNMLVQDSVDSAEPMMDLVDVFQALNGKQNFHQQRQEERSATLLASGQIFPTSTLDILICQSFYNPHLLSVLQLLISSNGSAQLEELKLELASSLGDFQDSNLYQVAIPRAFVEETYGDLFQHFTRQQGILPLGLLRAMYPEDSLLARSRRKLVTTTPTSKTLRYVSMNPMQSQILHKEDRVFVLSPHPPEGAFTDRGDQAARIMQELEAKIRAQRDRM